MNDRMNHFMEILNQDQWPQYNNINGLPVSSVTFRAVNGSAPPSDVLYNNGLHL